MRVTITTTELSSLRCRVELDVPDDIDIDFDDPEDVVRLLDEEIEGVHHVETHEELLDTHERELRGIDVWNDDGTIRHDIEFTHA